MVKLQILEHQSNQELDESFKKESIDFHKDKIIGDIEHVRKVFII
jgi:hypothetical protein